MGTVLIQRGHVPRTRGATGTYREQEFARRCSEFMEALLRARGHTVRLLDADAAVPAGGDCFVALHTDSGNAKVAGHGQSSSRGASVGYPDAAGGRYAAAWKAAHKARGYDGGFLPDNYTDGLRYYYGCRRSSARHRFIAEHGVTPNARDELLLLENPGPERWALAHVDAIGAVIGHPSTPKSPGGTMVDNITNAAIDPATGGIAAVGADGGVFTFQGARFHGSLPGLGVRPNGPIVAIVYTPDGGGYWLVGADGGIFAFGNAPEVATYGPLADEYRAGTVRVVDGDRTPEGNLLLTSNKLGSFYELVRA